MTNTFTPTDLQYILNEVWSPNVEREWQANLLAANLFTNLSDLLVGGGDTIHITDIFTNQFSAATKTNTSEVTLNSPAQAQINLSVDTWKEVSFLIEDKEVKQMLQSARMPSEYASQAKYIIAKALDTAILANYSTLSQTVNDTASDVSAADIRVAIEDVVDGDVSLDQLFFIFHPTVVWHDLMALSQFTTVSTAGSLAGYAGANLTGTFGGVKGSKSYMGMLYGIPVYQSTQIPSLGSTSYFNLLAHPKTFAYAIQGGIRSQANYLPENLGTLWTTDIIFGTTELRDETGVVIKSQQAGIVS